MHIEVDHRCLCFHAPPPEDFLNCQWAEHTTDMLSSTAHCAGVVVRRSSAGSSTYASLHVHVHAFTLSERCPPAISLLQGAPSEVAALLSGDCCWAVALCDPGDRQQHSCRRCCCLLQLWDSVSCVPLARLAHG